MQRRWLKIVAKYGMSTHKSAHRIHLINPVRTELRVVEGRPELTKYHVEWWCTTPSDRTPLKFLWRLPPGQTVCHLCIARKELFEWASARDQVRRENFIFSNQSSEAPF